MYTIEEQHTHEQHQDAVHWRLLMEQSRDGIVILDQNGQVFESNQRFAIMLGYPDDAMKKLKVMDWEFLHPPERALKMIRSVDEKGDFFETRHRRKDGSIYDVEISTNAAWFGGRKLIFCICRDITARKLAENYRDMGWEILQILNESSGLEESIEHILTTLKERTEVDAVALRLQKGEDFPYLAQKGFPMDFIQMENTLLERDNAGDVCRKMDGNISLECTCGLVISGKTDPSNPLFTKGGSCWTNDSSPLLDLPLDQDPRLQPRNNCIHQGYASVALIPIRTKDRIVGLLQLNDKRKDRFTMETIEILESIAAHIGSALMRRQAEEALEHKNEELEQFVYSVSHDLKSPLITIKSFLSELRQDVKSNNQKLVNEDIKYIEGATTKMDQLLGALLKYSRVGLNEQNTTTVSVENIIDSCLDSLAGPLRNTQVEIQEDATPLQLRGDELRLGQIWQNLIENAVKYMGDQTEPRIEIGALRQTHELVFYVRDNGVGIASENQQHIFTIFSQLNPGNEGSGLGLALVKKIVDLYGGRIWVESAGEGQGSCFYFTLPEALTASDKTR